MKSTCEEFNKPSSNKYPYLALYSGKKVFKPGDWFDGPPAKFVVLMESPSSGTIVSVIQDGGHPNMNRVGRHSDSWNEILFTKFEGKITLENE